MADQIQNSTKVASMASEKTGLRGIPLFSNKHMESNELAKIRPADIVKSILQDSGLPNKITDIRFNESQKALFLKFNGGVIKYYIKDNSLVRTLAFDNFMSKKEALRPLKNFEKEFLGNIIQIFESVGLNGTQDAKK